MISSIKINKIFMLQLILMILLSISRLNFGMEKVSRPYLVIKDVKGNLFSVSKATLSQFSFFKDLIEQTDNDEKFCDISFKGFEHHFLIYSILSRVFSCTIKENDESISPYDIFDAACWLGAPRFFLRNLTLYLRKKWKRNHSKEVDSGIFLNSIKNLFNERYLKEEIQPLLKNIDEGFYKNRGFCLDLQDKELDTLQGLKKVSQILKDSTVIMINLNNNFLKKLNVKKLSKLFPQLKIMCARKNCIKRLRIIKLSQNFVLDLENNRIKNVGNFLAETGSKINLKGNNLTYYAKKNINDAFSLSLLDAFDKTSAIHGINFRQDRMRYCIFLIVPGAVISRYLLSHVCNDDTVCTGVGLGINFSLLFFSMLIFIISNPQYFLTHYENLRDDDFAY